MKVIIDSREGKRIKQASAFFEKKGHSVQVKQMKYGDFLSGNTCIEYKTTKDFIQSVQSRRVFRQAINMSNKYEHSFVFVEAEHDKMDKAIRSSRFCGIPFSWNGYYGAIASLSTYTKVIIVKNFTEALKFMEHIFEKCNDNKIRNFIAPPTTDEKWCINFLACEKGDNIGVTIAKRIVDELEINTLTDLLNLTKEDLMSVKGIGENTANKVMRRIK